jgi:hypothetical protein
MKSAQVNKMSLNVNFGNEAPATEIAVAPA